MLNLIKKSKKLIIKGALKLKVFLVLFSLFFSSLALAAPLSVTWKGALIPGGNEQRWTRKLYSNNQWCST